MSTLAASTLEDRASTDSTAVLNAVHGSAKAWVDYNQSTPLVNDSYNVDSVTDNSAGNFTINITNDFANTTYTAAGSCLGNFFVQISAKAAGTTTMLVKTTNGSNTLTDAISTVMLIGDQ